jgi:aspartyl protease family protein
MSSPSRNFMASVALTAGFLCSTDAYAHNVNLVGTFGSKALVSIDGSAPRKMAPGDKSPEGVVLVSVSGNSATFEIYGDRHTLQMGQHYQASTGNNQTAILSADGRGHFIKQGKINGGAVTFMVDTGASAVAMSADEARRMGILYMRGTRTMVGTANGVVPAYRVKLDTVNLDGITLTNVDALVTEASMPYVLLGMSFLNRTEMKRSGDQMTLIRRF